MGAEKLNSPDYFELRPLKTAKVSEISEATAASSVAPEERLNFHIGNPVQDNRLYQDYFRLTTGIESHILHSDDPSKIEHLNDRGWQDDQTDSILFLENTIKKSAPYLPRGGYHRKFPGPLIEHINQWLSDGQTEPLTYNFGKESSQRECILASGGIWESLRVLFHALSTYLVRSPAEILLYHVELPAHLRQFQNLAFTGLYDSEETAYQNILDRLNRETLLPTFLILGSIISESMRRRLRQLALKKPLFFIEINQAENHLSFAREAKMENRVLRILTAGIMRPAYEHISVEFILGNAAFLKIIETSQFELKGTPSVTEIELLTHLLTNQPDPGKSSSPAATDRIENNFPDPIRQKDIYDTHLIHTLSTIDQLVQKVQDTTEIVSNCLGTLEKYEKSANDKIQTITQFSSGSAGTLAEKSAGEIVHLFFENINNRPWLTELSGNFLEAFARQHPEYLKDNLQVISGSARTALSLLGFHCGFKEVITADLGWTYEHCFPQVSAISLTESLTLDKQGIIKAVENKVIAHEDWKKYGAVILNNPHNASGHVVDEQDLSSLLLWLLENKIYVIDDLSYQNVLPEDSLKGPKTLRQLSQELAKNGYLTASRLKYLITVHSLSKTDCFAGARLAVVEITDPDLHHRFYQVTKTLKPNVLSLLLAYLFYRNDPIDVNGYWLLRNRIFSERMQALEKTTVDLPEERNPYALTIRRPQGSMYPQLVINKLPKGLSLDWLSSNLATQGIGMIPFSTFARTAEGFEIARKSFRLTLGGSDNAAELSRKTRRLLISLNHLIANEEAKYNLQTIHKSSKSQVSPLHFPDLTRQWTTFEEQVHTSCKNYLTAYLKKFSVNHDSQIHTNYFQREYIPFRLSVLRQQLQSRLDEAGDILEIINSKKKVMLLSILDQEFYKDSPDERSLLFRRRLFDRTVHPTQMYALNVDLVFRDVIEEFTATGSFSSSSIKRISENLTKEYFGLNIPVTSIDEADELVCDLRSFIAAEKYIHWNSSERIPPLLSFWGDWDGSNRPSGQGHRLVAASVLENVTQMAHLLTLLRKYEPGLDLDADLQKEINQLSLNKQKFWRLLNNITRLTNQLEKRYQGFIPLELSYSKFRKAAMRMHLFKDPLTALWQHNDRLEKRMLHMRLQRQASLEYYFSLNKKLRKTLHQLLPKVEELLRHPEVATMFGSYRDLLKRFVLTPRIHQRIITSDDPFTIDTTVHNIMEINELSGKFGNPGMVMGLQVSMSTEPEAFIMLDRKLNARREQVLRDNPNSAIPSIWIIPLFEDVQSIENLKGYLDKIWSYATQSRKIDQSREERFTEMICEIFIAGSDLSQQIGQAAAASLYGQAKSTTMRWLAERGLVEKVRMKFGSGESMQRQGGFYDLDSERPLFIRSTANKKRMDKNLEDSTQRSTEFAKSPLRGVLTSGDLRTFQSAISEKLRFLSVEERANLFYHMMKAQRFHDSELARISEPLLETRLQFKNRGFQELDSFIRGNQDQIYDEFLSLITNNFRQILYGHEDDVVGIHVISHFISRSLPELRDRPTVRPSRDMGKARGQQIIERVAQTLPLCKHGSMLRAIGHNRAQTMVLGVNQLTTGLFRALNEFANHQAGTGDTSSLISNRILPHLPVREILQSLFLYHDPTLEYVKKMERAFPAGNSSFLYIQEDLDSIPLFIGLLQKEYIRRFGLDTNDFFTGNVFNPDLLPVIRPEIAILLQKDIFNTNFELFVSKIEGNIEGNWRDEVQKLLKIPDQIKYWRKKIWQSIQQPLYGQVNSFVELALAIHTISSVSRQSQQPITKDLTEVLRLGSHVARLLRSTGDDSMRQFLTDVVQLLTQIPGTMTEIPVDIIRALRDVERIVQIEEQLLSSKEQDLVRFYLLQIARLSGENG